MIHQCNTLFPLSSRRRGRFTNLLLNWFIYQTCASAGRDAQRPYLNAVSGRLQHRLLPLVYAPILSWMWALCESVDKSCLRALSKKRATQTFAICFKTYQKTYPDTTVRRLSKQQHVLCSYYCLALHPAEHQTTPPPQISTHQNKKSKPVNEDRQKLTNRYTPSAPLRRRNLTESVRTYVGVDVFRSA